MIRDEKVRVLLRGGPLDGTEQFVDPADLAPDEPLMFTPDQRVTEDPQEAPGILGLIEYLYRGDGVADYVGGLTAS